MAEESRKQPPSALRKTFQSTGGPPVAIKPAVAMKSAVSSASGAVRRRPVITVMDARPMSEVGFRGVSGDASSSSTASASSLASRPNIQENSASRSPKPTPHSLHPKRPERPELPARPTSLQPKHLPQANESPPCYKDVVDLISLDSPEKKSQSSEESNVVMPQSQKHIINSLEEVFSKQAQHHEISKSHEILSDTSLRPNVTTKPSVSNAPRKPTILRVPPVPAHNKPSGASPTVTRNGVGLPTVPPHVSPSRNSTEPFIPSRSSSLQKMEEIKRFDQNITSAGTLSGIASSKNSSYSDDLAALSDISQKPDDTDLSASSAIEKSAIKPLPRPNKPTVIRPSKAKPTIPQTDSKPDGSESDIVNKPLPPTPAVKPSYRPTIIGKPRQSSYGLINNGFNSESTSNASTAALVDLSEDVGGTASYNDQHKDSAETNNNKSNINKVIMQSTLIDARVDRSSPHQDNVDNENKEKETVVRKRKPPRPTSKPPRPKSMPVFNKGPQKQGAVAIATLIDVDISPDRDQRETSPASEKTVSRDCDKTRPAKPTAGPQHPQASARPPAKSSAHKPAKPQHRPDLPRRPGPGHPLFHYTVTGPHGIALYDYMSDGPDDLQMKAGDVVVLVGYVDAQWMWGRNVNQEGTFPATFIEIVEPLPDNAPIIPLPSSNKRGASLDVQSSVIGPRCRARFDYESDAEGDLNFKAGDVIILTKRVAAEWLKGNRANQSGMFPVSFVEIIEDLPPDVTVEEQATEDENSVTALHDYFGESNDLSFKAGAKIKVLGIVNEEWLYGELHGGQGSFPAAYVSHIPPGLPAHQKEPAVSKDNETEAPVTHHSVKPSIGQELHRSTESHHTSCRALHDFEGQSPDELTFKQGDVIEVILTVNEDWLKGSLNGKEGMFPKAFIKELSDSDCSHEIAQMSESAVPTPHTESKHASIPHAKALYDYMGQAEGDLSFKEGDIIYLEEQLGDDWMRGKLDDQSGVFPANHIKVLVPLS